MATATPSDPSMVNLSTCPICFTLVQPPVYQCTNGHIVCSRCREQIEVCHSCREPLGYIRCFILEQLASTLTTPCSNQSLGCPKTLRTDTRHEHEQRCPFRPITCPLFDDHCNWNGRNSEFKSHLIQAHPQVPLINKTSFLFLGIDSRISAPVTWAAIMECYDQQLLITVRKQHTTRPNYIIKFHNFTRINPFKLEYNIKFRKGDISLKWTSTLVSDQEPRSTSTSSLEIPETLIRSFCQGNNFKFAVSVSNLNN
ncbi:E3 ubiquitin-protein ligase Siah1-like [Centruroides sculpturatus]|uniref:E3 ubiquitin-protein ligase Siah1-like n=1 Tax=Centruroides sculpturatus TaxID=218467 RepID=UPI000C6EB980|nr:E3 ubiquitin-protein ligase Siah1-like [Centruroides sculpturatus]